MAGNLHIERKSYKIKLSVKSCNLNLPVNQREEPEEGVSPV